MSYRRPFTREQRREASREYESFRKNYRQVRDAFPPCSAAAKTVLADYRRRIRTIKTELLVTDRLVRVDELNAAVHFAKAAMAEYLQLWYSESRGES